MKLACIPLEAEEHGEDKTGLCYADLCLNPDVEG